MIKKVKEYNLKKVNATRMALSLVLATSIVIYCVMSTYTATDMRTKLMESSTRGIVTTEAIVQVMERYGHTLKDPSLDDLTGFLNKDDTNKQKYTDEFVCTQFTAMLISNALVAGWNCAVVEVLFCYYFLPIVGSGHAMVAFNTTDHGTVFVEPQSDGIMSVLKKGDSYFNQQILDVKIIWCKNA
jgi:hypothetical protein